MATSLRDLTALLHQESRYATDPRSRDALRALTPLGRALDRLIVDGLDVTRTAARETQARDLAEACLAAGSVATTTAHAAGGLTDVAATVSDLLGVIRFELNRDQRWAIVAELADTARMLTMNASDDPAVPPAADLRWTHRAARTICIAALRDPPPPQAQAILDRAVPAVTATTGPPTMQIAAESLLAISDRLRRVEAGQAPPPMVYEIFAATHAAEATARAGAAALARLRDADGPGPAAALDVWTDVRAALRPFLDSGRAATPTTAQPQHDLVRWALSVHLGLRGAFGQLGAPGGAGIEDLQRMLHELPTLADTLVAALGALADRGDLHALASRLAFSQDRIEEYLHHRPVIARQPDLTASADALAQAAGLGACLAVDLTHATGGDSVNGLAAANAVRAEQQNTPVDRWRSFGRSIDPVLTRDPSWARLAAAIQQAHAADVDVVADLPRLAKRFPLDEQQPAADLLYRLISEHPTLQTPLPSQGHRNADIAQRPTPPAVPVTGAPSREPPGR